MKAAIFGVIMIIAVVQGGVVHLLPSSTTTLVRTPSHDTAVVRSERLNGGFSYSTVENHAYAPVVHHTVPLYHYNVYPQIPQVYYPAQHPIYTFQPAYYPPTFGGIPLPAGPAPNPQNPVEVESPADNLPNEEFQSNGDEDTVSVESA